VHSFEPPFVASLGTKCAASPVAKGWTPEIDDDWIDTG
jgi:hypothetical protein